MAYNINIEATQQGNTAVKNLDSVLATHKAYVESLSDALSSLTYEGFVTDSEEQSKLDAIISLAHKKIESISTELNISKGNLEEVHDEMTQFITKVIEEEGRSVNALKNS